MDPPQNDARNEAPAHPLAGCLAFHRIPSLANLSPVVGKARTGARHPPQITGEAWGNVRQRTPEKSIGLLVVLF